MSRPAARPSAAPARRGLVALLVAAMLIASSAAICQVWTRLRAIEYGYKISSASREHTELLEVNRRLRLEAAVLTNPARIARVAQGEIGLRPPAPDQIRRLRGARSARRPPTLARAIR